MACSHQVSSAERRAPQRTAALPARLHVARGHRCTKCISSMTVTQVRLQLDTITFTECSWCLTFLTSRASTTTAAPPPAPAPKLPALPAPALLRLPPAALPLSPPDAAFLPPPPPFLALPSPLPPRLRAAAGAPPTPAAAAEAPAPAGSTAAAPSTTPMRTVGTYKRMVSSEHRSTYAEALYSASLFHQTAWRCTPREAQHCKPCCICRIRLPHQ